MSQHVWDIDYFDPLVANVNGGGDVLVGPGELELTVSNPNVSQSINFIALAFFPGLQIDIANLQTDIGMPIYGNRTCQFIGAFTQNGVIPFEISAPPAHGNSYIVIPPVWIAVPYDNQIGPSANVVISVEDTLDLNCDDPDFTPPLPITFQSTYSLAAMGISIP